MILLEEFTIIIWIEIFMIKPKSLIVNGIWFREGHFLVEFSVEFVNSQCALLIDFFKMFESFLKGAVMFVWWIQWLYFASRSVIDDGPDFTFFLLNILYFDSIVILLFIEAFEKWCNQLLLILILFLFGMVFTVFCFGFLD